MKKCIIFLYCSFFVSINLFSQNECKNEKSYINDSLTSLYTKGDDLGSIINVVESYFKIAKTPSLWQLVDLNIKKSDNKVLFQFTGLVFMPNSLKFSFYNGVIHVGSRFYLVRTKDIDLFTSFFTPAEKVNLNIDKHMPFIMENPIWLFSLKEDQEFKLEKVINEETLKEI